MEIRESYKKEFEAVLAEAIDHFDSSVESDASMITIVADVDNGRLLFGGMKLREDLEEEGEWNNNSQIFYTAESKYLKSCYKTFNKNYEDYEAEISYNYDGLMGYSEKLSFIMGEAIIDENLRKKLSGKLLYGWCGAMKQMADADNFWSSCE